MNNATIEPYLFFAGRCEEAIEFYKAALGAETEMLMRFSESPDAPPPGAVPDGYGDKIMHATLKIGNTKVLVSDGCEADKGYEGFSLAIQLASEEDAEKAFSALAEGGQVTMPLSKTFWSPKFGMLTDKFGIGWMVNVAV